jgi:pantetheine-phosphate adenylyltransferase
MSADTGKPWFLFSESLNNSIGMEKMKKNNESICIYPGSFDPITNGHLNLIERALHIFEKVIVAIANNPAKIPLFSVEERKELIEQSVKRNPRIIIDAFDGLLVDYAQHKAVRVILRGLRAMSDFDYEFQMTFMNRKLNRNLDTIFMMTGLSWFYVNSRIIKEAVMSGGSVEGLVPDFVNEKLKEKLIGKTKF